MAEIKLEYKNRPGSAEAIANGCICPVINNHFGRGYPAPDGPRFWINLNCLAHGAEQAKDEPRNQSND